MGAAVDIVYNSSVSRCL